MAKYLRYSGGFVSRKGTNWYVQIEQEGETPYTVGELEFDTDPLTIEWQRRDKETVICGSSATLKIISPGDRTYEDLYAIEAGSIRIKVYKGGTAANNLYWSGTLDTEFYEEPYERYSGYIVSLTFSDFGILSRTRYALSGMQTLLQLVQYCLGSTGIAYRAINTSYVSTQIEADTPITGGALSVLSENFIDEDGVASTLEEVLEGILQPLALKIVQRAGYIYIYDLNGLYTAASAKRIDWDGDSQTLGTDKVANNITVSFSPYSAEVLMRADSLEYGGKYDVTRYNLTSDDPGEIEFGDYYSYYPDYDESHRVGYEWDYSLIDFTIFVHSKGKGLASIGTGCKYFHILPITGSGSETTGVAYAFRTGGHGSISTGWPRWKVNSGVHRNLWSLGREVLTTNKVFIPALDSVNQAKYRIRVCEELMIDARYNPLSGATSGNDEDNDNTIKTRSAFVFIPVTITLYDDNGVALYHYKNSDIAKNWSIGRLFDAKGEWVAGADPGGDCYLEYYKTDNLKEDTGIRGWTKNRHCIGRPDGSISIDPEQGVVARGNPTFFDSFKKMADGEYLPYPPVGGYIEVSIKAGFRAFDYSGDVFNFDGWSWWDEMNYFDLLRWCLYKAPQVEVVNNNLVFDVAELEDIDYSGVVNKAAKEEISIKTICGTVDKICPTARGIYFRTSDKLQIQTLLRAERNDHPEKLLIGTLYSQYADRKTLLSGEAVIDGGLHYYTERNQSGKRFMLLSDTQSIINDTTDAEYCEFRPDEYNGVLDDE